MSKAIAELENVRAEWIADKAKLEEGIAGLDSVIAMLKARGEEAPKKSEPKTRKPRDAAKANGSANGRAAHDVEGAQKTLLAELEDCPAGMTSRVLRDELGWPPIKFNAVVEAALAAGKITKFGERGGTSYKIAEARAA